MPKQYLLRPEPTIRRSVFPVKKNIMLTASTTARPATVHSTGISDLVVVGGGNSAVQEAMFLTRFASHIDLLCRSDKLRASEILQRDLREKHADKITVHYNTTTDEILGENGMVTKVLGTDKIAGKQVEFPTDGVFVFVGLKPNTEFLKNSEIDLDEIGFVKMNDNLETNIPGIFGAGDVRSGSTMQIATATGEGATAALRIREYLVEHAREYGDDMSTKRPIVAADMAA